MGKVRVGTHVRLRDAGGAGDATLLAPQPLRKQLVRFVWSSRARARLLVWRPA